MIAHRAERSSDGPAADRRARLLRLALRVDGVVSGLLGLLSLTAGSVLGELLGIPAALLAWLGAALVAYALLVWWTSVPAHISHLAASAVIVGNAAWSATSVVAVAAGWLPLTWLGVAFATLQAGVVAGFAVVQYVGLRRARA